jgi:hypothetical protein
MGSFIKRCLFTNHTPKHRSGPVFIKHLRVGVPIQDQVPSMSNPTLDQHSGMLYEYGPKSGSNSSVPVDSGGPLYRLPVHSVCDDLLLISTSDVCLPSQTEVLIFFSKCNKPVSPDLTQ